jgi:hypothetical protein
MSKPLDYSKPLLLIDCNGTLVHRSETRVSGVSEDLALRRRFVYARKDAACFISRLSNHFNICVYSSIMMHNILPILKLIQATRFTSRIFDRNYFKIDTEGANEW